MRQTYVMVTGATGRNLMSPTASTTAIQAWSLLLVAGICGVVVAGTLALWAYYGTTVFFEMVRAGWAACF